MFIVSGLGNRSWQCECVSILNFVPLDRSDSGPVFRIHFPRREQSSFFFNSVVQKIMNLVNSFRRHSKKDTRVQFQNTILLARNYERVFNPCFHPLLFLFPSWIFFLCENRQNGSLILLKHLPCYDEIYDFLFENKNNLVIQKEGGPEARQARPYLHFTCWLGTPRKTFSYRNQIFGKYYMQIVSKQ